MTNKDSQSAFLLTNREFLAAFLEVVLPLT